jgi:hypothetical protein
VWSLVWQEASAADSEVSLALGRIRLLSPKLGQLGRALADASRAHGIEGTQDARDKRPAALREFEEAARQSLGVEKT